jgi:hypothetical protein
MNLSSHNSEECIPWKTCAAGEFALQPGTFEQDRVCEPCPDETFRTEENHTFEFCDPWTTCGHGEFRLAGTGTIDTDVVCDVCSVGTYVATTLI